MKEEILRMERVTLIEEGVTMLNNINLNIFRSEIMGLMCVNAHGQEELIGLMRQNTPIHFGRIYFYEQLVNNHKHSSLSHNPVEMIEKRSRLVDSLTVADNVFVLRRGFRDHVIHPRKLNRQLLAFTDELGVHIAGGRYVDDLSVFERCVVEMLKAVNTGKRLIIMRDIGSFLNAAELTKIYGIMRYYTSRGISFVYVCNHHEEVFGLCDRAAIMENGKIQRIVEKRDMIAEAYEHPEQLKKLGRMARTPTPETRRQAAPVLRFHNVCTENIKGMCFAVYPGECVVMLTADEAVMDDLLSLAAGGGRPLSGEILVSGRPAAAHALPPDIAVVDEKPTQRMLFPHLSYLDNLCFTSDKRVRRIWRSRRIRKSVIREYYPMVGENIYVRDIRELSIRELYRLVYCRIYFQHPRVAVCVKPFSTIDISLRLYVSELIQKLQEKGIAVIILASSLLGSLPLADRLLTIRDGAVESEISREELQSLRGGDIL